MAVPASMRSDGTRLCDRVGGTTSEEGLWEPVRDVRCLFLDPFSSSTKGFGRVEEGSEEAARSLGSGDIDAESIGLVEVGFAPQVPELKGP